MSNVRFIGLDVHAETIAVATAEPTGEVRLVGVTAPTGRAGSNSRKCVLETSGRRHGGRRPNAESGDQ
jgi:hypothetical protein